MKKIGMVFVMVFIILGMFSLVSAEELEMEEAGRVPGDFFYGVDKAMDNFRVFMTFNKERKAERALRVAEERLSEIEKLTKEGRIEKAERARESYERFIDKSEKAIEGIESNEDISKSEAALRRITRTQNRIEAHQEKLEEIHLRIIEEKGDDLTEEELAKIDEIFTKLEKRSTLIGQRAISKLENIQTRHKVLANLSDEDLDNILDRIENEEGLKAKREERLIRHDARFIREVLVRESNIERLKERIDNSNLTEEEKIKILERIGDKEVRLQEFRVRKDILREKFQLRDDSTRGFRRDIGDRAIKIEKLPGVKSVSPLAVSGNSVDKIKNKANISTDYVATNSQNPVDLSTDVSSV